MASQAGENPLTGVRVLVTRPRHQAHELSDALRSRSAAPVEVPMIQIADPEDGGAGLVVALSTLQNYDWLIVTSPNGAARVAEVLAGIAGHRAVRVGAIGPATAKVLELNGIEIDLLPERFVAEGLVDSFPAPPRGGGRVLLARAAEARSVLPDSLGALGWAVDDVACYRTVAASITETQRASVHQADVVTFTASSAVRHFIDLVGLEALPNTVACIGPATAAVARDLGMSVDVEADVHTLEGLVVALEEYFAQRQ